MKRKQKHKKNTADYAKFWICREYALCLRIWCRLLSKTGSIVEAFETALAHEV